MKIDPNGINDDYKDMKWHKRSIIYMIGLTTLLFTTTINMNMSWSYVVVSSLALHESHFLGSFIIGPVSALSFFTGDNLSATEIFLSSYIIFLAWANLVYMSILPRIHAWLIRQTIILNLYSFGANGYPLIKDSIVAALIIAMPYIVLNCFVIEYLFSDDSFVRVLGAGYSAVFSDMFGG